ncbi:DNA-binding domain-containing protein [Oleiagrimonas sp. C23AA]|uniref:HvfC/BufC N-terminal domain-containing protein n=1 Tax=Oleiagrimonas sp. C23AA TaxID=2719047 RepID=UPI001424A38B|nr:DNA-binding domain-containing protein [Oleiagrimonas sp. C23AA]NII11339.1 DUF2063 domain-containing protein [Oleiagrimonas sp. C23AA]
MSRGPSLGQLQYAFAAMMQDDLGSLPVWVAGNGLEPVARLRVYRHSIRAVHASALETTFPALLAWVGEACFADLCDRVAAQTPSRSGNLQHYGAGMAAQVSASAVLATYPWLPDLARLEWQRQACLLAPDMSRGDTRHLMRALADAEGDVRLRLAPHVHAMDVAYDVLDLWRHAIEPGPNMPSIRRSACGVVLWRDGGQVAMQSVSVATARAVSALIEGCALSLALQRAGLDDAMPMLQLLVEGQWLADIEPVSDLPVPGA